VENSSEVVHLPSILKDLGLIPALKNTRKQAGYGVHTCTLSSQKAEAGGSEFEFNLRNTARPCLKAKQKIEAVS
jgi:hypothetical protein